MGGVKECRREATNLNQAFSSLALKITGEGKAYVAPGSTAEQGSAGGSVLEESSRQKEV